MQKHPITSSLILPKLYWNVCEEKAPEYSDYENFNVNWGKPDYYEVIKKLGRGKYSEVYVPIYQL